jgi:hypothetical protein
MANPAPRQSLAAARESLARPLDFAEFLARLPAKDRVNAEKRVAALEAGPDPRRAALWRRLVCVLTTLAGHAAKFVGKQTVQFYVADGLRYRMQVFALEDLQDGYMTIYCPDALAEAVKAGVLAAADAPAHMYFIPSSNEPLRVESLDGNSLDPGAHFKDMTGWNRKALRITLPPSPSSAQLEATELLCAVAAGHFIRPAPGSAPPPGGGLTGKPPAGKP